MTKQRAFHLNGESIWKSPRPFLRDCTFNFAQKHVRDVLPDGFHLEELQARSYEALIVEVHTQKTLANNKGPSSQKSLLLPVHILVHWE